MDGYTVLFAEYGGLDEELFEDGTSRWSWDTLSANTWTLGNGED